MAREKGEQITQVNTKLGAERTAVLDEIIREHWPDIRDYPSAVKWLIDEHKAKQLGK